MGKKPGSLLASGWPLGTRDGGFVPGTASFRGGLHPATLGSFVDL